MDLIYARRACNTPKTKENMKSHHELEMDFWLNSWNEVFEDYHKDFMMNKRCKNHKSILVS